MPTFKSTWLSSLGTISASHVIRVFEKGCPYNCWRGNISHITFFVSTSAAMNYSWRSLAKKFASTKCLAAPRCMAGNEIEWPLRSFILPHFYLLTLNLLRYQLSLNWNELKRQLKAPADNFLGFSFILYKTFIIH